MKIGVLPDALLLRIYILSSLPAKDVVNTMFFVKTMAYILCEYNGVGSYG